MLQIKNNIISTLSYFSCFNYPLTKEELLEYIHFGKFSKTEIENTISNLVIDQKIQKIENYYGLEIDANTIFLRKKRNQLANKMLQKAHTIAKFLKYFPFVLGISISGSLSKNSMDVDSDIDYFIITSKNRVNFSQLLLRGFTKLFFSQRFRSKYFCLNYLIDEENLVHQHQNLFTATEINFLIPLTNIDLFNKFKQKNEWIKAYYPNANTNSYNPKIKPLTFCKISNFWIFIFNNFIGDWFEKKAQQFFINKKKQVILRENLLFTKKESDINFKNVHNELKLHYKNNETKILDLYNLKILKYKL